MANVRITALPTAQSPLNGTELVPIVQNGVTVQTTVNAITQTPSLTGTFLTVGQQPLLPNSRYVATGTGIGFTDGGAQNPYTFSLNGTSGSLETVSTGVIVKTAASTVAARSLAVSGNGISVSNGNGIAGNPTFQLTGLAQALANATGSGLLAMGLSTTVSPVTIVGVPNQISVLNGSGSGNPTIGLADNPVVPGDAGLVIPTGTTAERGAGADGQVRYNTDTASYEGYSNGIWEEFSPTSGTVGTFSAGVTGFSPSVPTSGNIVLSGTLNSTSGGTGASALTGYLYGNGASAATASTTVPTSDLSGTISNAQLDNSSLTVNGQLIPLGGSGTIAAENPNALTIGTGLNGTTYNGANPVTIDIANTTVFAGAYGSATAVPTYTVNSQGQLIAAANVSIAIPSTAITDKGLPNGIASLNSGGTVPLTQLPASISGGLNYRGTWNANTNTPTLVSSVGTANDYYVVSVAGTTNLNGVNVWAVNDLAIFSGTVWQKVSNSNPTIITANSTSPALTVTQTGTGNALVVEDSASDTTPFVIDSNGNVSVGGTLTAGGFPVVDQTDIGSAPNEIPLNGFLGNLAYQDAANIAGDVGIGGAVTATGGVINANNTTNALRITQLGTGNALLVEDSANPDATPFVITSNGTIGQGSTSPTTTGFNGGFISTNAAAFAPQLVFQNTTNDANSPFYILEKSRAGAIVSSADVLGTFASRGYDGANYITSASIQMIVDGTPGTNDMPGRIIFNTTPDGTNGSLERMRIDNAGRVGINVIPDSRSQLTIGGTAASSGNESQIMRISSVIPSTSTVSARGYQTILSTQAASFTVAELSHFIANQSTIGAGSTVTNQFGFSASATLTGATNNYGFYGNIPAAANRWNFYAAGTAQNYFAGQTEIVSGLTIGRTAVTAPAATDGNVFSGTYTPTLTNTTNIDASTAYTCQYMRVGNVVTVSGRVDIDPTAAGIITLGMSLPIASNFATAQQMGGTYSSGGGSVNVGRISADVTNDRASFEGPVVAIINTGFHFSFTYLVV